MTLKKIRQFLKAVAEDKRLRIVNVVKHKELTVNEICSILKTSQPTVSKHLTRLRLLGIVTDRRKGNFVYYGLNRKSESSKVVNTLFRQFKDLKTFKDDINKLKTLKT
ncbi:MAG: winged helix-turn-helix transcriptional regulator [Candidatus Omnitrophica bacterium]|nr:winged helix-turn-helix transcriptional regulator [Candidatus Omnitrophota bacterium]